MVCRRQFETLHSKNMAYHKMISKAHCETLHLMNAEHLQVLDGVCVGQTFWMTETGGLEDLIKYPYSEL